MALQFSSNPTVGDVEHGFRWNGTAWVRGSSGISTIPELPEDEHDYFLNGRNRPASGGTNPDPIQFWTRVRKPRSGNFVPTPPETQSGVGRTLTVTGTGELDYAWQDTNDATARQTANAANTRANANTREVTLARAEALAAQNLADSNRDQIVLSLYNEFVFGGNATDIQGTYHLSAQINEGAYSTAVRAEIHITDNERRNLSRVYNGAFVLEVGNPGRPVTQQVLEFEINAATADNLVTNNLVTVGDELGIALSIYASGNVLLGRQVLEVPIVSKTAASGGLNQAEVDARVTVGVNNRVTADQVALFARRNPTSIHTLTFNARGVAPDFDNGLMQRMTLTGNLAAFNNPTNVQTGDVFVIELVQDGTGSRTVTSWGSNINWPGGTAPTLSTDANARDIITLLALSPTVLVGGPIIGAHS